jgi:hypothetical protein
MLATPGPAALEAMRSAEITDANGEAILGAVAVAMAAATDRTGEHPHRSRCARYAILPRSGATRSRRQ